MSNIIIKLVRLITNRCQVCGEHLSCANNNDFEYGLWYCPKCDGEVENDCIKDNKLVNSNSGNEEEVKNGNK